MGFCYSWLAGRKSTEPDSAGTAEKPYARIVRAGLWVVAVLIAIVVIFGMRNVLQSRSADLAAVISTETVGSHWSDSTLLSRSPMDLSDPDIDTNKAGQIAVTWSEETGSGADVYFIERRVDWSEPVNVSNSSDTLSSRPQLVLDESGTAHIVSNEAGVSPGDANIFFSQCQAGVCSEPIRLAEPSLSACADGTEIGTTTAQAWPAVAVDGSGMVMVVWPTDDGQLLYNGWSTGESPQSDSAGCVLTDGLSRDLPDFAPPPYGPT